MSDSPSSGGCFDLDTKRVTLSTREAQMGEPKFWDVPDRAREVIQEVNTLKNWIEPYDRLEAKLREMTELDQLLNTEHDTELSDELDRELATFDDQLSTFELRSMLQGPDDHRNAMVEISAGAGGTEAQDWAAMLLRMYTRWAERRGFAVEVLDVSEGEEAGIKGAMVEIRGQYAYGFLRSEAGVHRLVRISPFDSQSRRHTSFASVFVYPDVDEEINIEVRDEDIQHGCVPRIGRGRPARQQDQLRGAAHAHSVGHRHELPAATLAAQEQGDGDQDAQERALSARGGGARAQEGRDRFGEDGRLVRQSDSELRVPALHDGQRSSHGAQDHRCRRR